MKILFSIVFLGIFQWIIRCQDCFKNLPFYTSESDIQKEVDQLLANSDKQQISENCLQFLIRRGYHNQVIQLYENYFLKLEKSQKDKVNSGVRILNSQVKRGIDQFQTHFQSSHAPTQVVQPAIQWAQSNSSIFIQGKLGLRMDSPACLNCRVQDIDISENHFNYTSFGIYSHQPVLFNLYLEFEYPIDIEKSIYKGDAVVGTLYFEFAKKEESTLWHKPALNIKSKIPIWWDMREKHRSVMTKWSEMLEEESLQRENEAKQKRRDEKKKRKQERMEKKKQKRDERKKKKQQEEGTIEGWYKWAKNKITG